MALKPAGAFMIKMISTSGLETKLKKCIFSFQNTDALGVAAAQNELGIIAQNAYCSRDIYFQFNKVRRSVILRAIMQRLYESASSIGCPECTTKLINML